MSFGVWQSKEDYLEFNGWQGEARPQVEVLFSLRGKEKEFLNFLANRECDTPLQIVSLRQIHSSQVFVVNGPVDYEEVSPQGYPWEMGRHTGLSLQGDGLITSKFGLWLTVSVADCLPVYIYDANKRVIGLIHAGKKGTQDFILRKALSLLLGEFHSNPANIYLLFGPSICPRCYDYDIWANNIKQAEELGIGNIINPKICTAEYPTMFYSYRREKGTTGRMISAIRLKK